MPVLDGNFEAFVTNLGKYNEGMLVGEWVKLPTTEEEMQKVFERIGIGKQDEFGQPYEEWFITDYECPIYGVQKMLGEYESLDKLNYLAALIDELSLSDQEKLVAIMEAGCDEVSDIDDLINLTFNLDCYDIMPGINDEYDLGYYYANEAGIYSEKDLGPLADYALRDEDGDIYDVVAGTFMVVGLTDDSFGSLTVEQMQKFADHFKVPEQFVKLGDKIVAIPMISKEQQKQESIEQKDFEMNADTSGLTVAGHIGTWHTIDQHEVGGHSFYLMEHDTYGDEAACIIVDERGKLVLDDVYNGFDDDTLRLLDLEVKEVPEMPDPALSVQDMKDYGYAWAGVLPAGQEAAEKALEKGCEVYRLYSDNTEGLCVDAKEIADHATKGGMLGISKESWMAALEKENYLKAAEMSMEDDYGMIDGIINNGPKEDKTAEVKAPERGEKSSIMDRLKSAKAEKQKECCPPQKHKGEIEL